MFDYGHLAALRAIIQLGSFEAAASALNVTPSAISQRIKSLEEQLGSVLIIRGNPASASPAGQRLFRHAQEVALLENGLGSDLDGMLSQGSASPIRVVVNADSLDTWFIQAMAKTTDFLFDISTDDQDFSADWLRRGEVMAAVTANPKPVQGCDCIALGSLRYLATASPDFADQYFSGGFDETGAKQAPMLMFNRKDQSQYHWLKRAFGKKISPPVHLLPTTCGFVEAAVAGLGWGLNPAPLVRDYIKSGTLICVGKNPVYDVPLFWQFNRITAKALAPVTKAIKQTASQWLEQ